MSRKGVFLVVSRPRSIPCRDVPMAKWKGRQILTRRPRCVTINDLGTTVREGSAEVIFGFYAQQAQLLEVDAVQCIKGRIIRRREALGDDHAGIRQLRQAKDDRVCLAP